MNMESPLKIPLTQGKFTLVDKQDFESVSKHKWCFSKTTGYALRALPRVHGKKKHEYLHRVICKAPEGYHIDHKNCDRLDNRRSNLRFASKADNQRNKPRQKNNTSGFKGVSWHSHNKMWVAKLHINRKRVHLGYFKDPAEASKAYEVGAQKHFGQFARL